MQKAQLRFQPGFDVSTGNPRSQAATMTVEPGGSVGGPENRHAESDQWLYVVSGEGMAVINGEEHVLSAGELLLIEQGDTHEIRNPGTAPLQTLNVYLPPAYTPEGERLRRPG